MRLWLLDQKSFGMKTEMEVLYTSYTGEGVRNVGETRFGGNLNWPKKIVGNEDGHER